MNVTCPNCATVYRVDPAKVPEGGVRARCAVCGAVFAVQAQPAGAAAPTPRPAPVAMPEPPVSPAPPPTPEPVIATPAAAPVPPVAAEPPVSRPAAVPPPATPSAPRPAAPPVRPPVVATPARPAARGNPFLSQDPSLKARRLARALISDMVVYHPAKRKEGLRNGNLKELFEEEIKKSWEEYAEQVGKEIAESTPYFREALNEILADGQPIF